MQMTRGSVDAIKEIVKLGNRISVEEMGKISDLAEAAGGTLASVDPDGDWCGNGSIRFPWPPKNSDAFVKVLDRLVTRWINYEVLINGIPVPDHIVINLSRHNSRMFGHHFG